MKQMEHNYFSEEDVLEMLGGLEEKYVQNRKTFFRLKNGNKLLFAITPNPQFITGIISSVIFYIRMHNM